MNRSAFCLGLFLLATNTSLAQETDPDKTPSTKTPKEYKEQAKKKPEDIPEEPLLPKLTVTGHRDGGREAFDLPQSLYVITEEDIRGGSLPRSTPELLARASPAISGQETSRGQGSPFIRGFTSRRNLLLVDGIRINNSVFRSGPNQYTATIDPFSLGRAEVITGATSLLHGSDALGGVMKLETRRPGEPTHTLRDWLLGKGRSSMDRNHFIRGEVFTRFMSADKSTTLRVGARGREGNLGFIGGYTVQNFGNLRAGKNTGKLDNTDYSMFSSDLKFIHEVDDKTDITVAWQRTDQRNVPRTHSTISSKSYRGTSIGSDTRRDLDQSRQLLYTQAEIRDKGFVDYARLSLSWQRQYESQSRDRSNGRHERQGFEVHSLGIFLEMSSTLFDDLTANYGFDYYHDFVDTFFTRTETDGRVRRRGRGGFADDSQYDLLGVYLMLEAPIHEMITLTGGLRWEFANINADDVDPDPTDTLPISSIDKSYWGFIVSGGVVVHAMEGLDLIASVSQGFRAPNLDDITSFQAVRSNAFDTPAADLDPERTTTYELGVKYSHDQWGFLQAFLYYTDLRNFIARVPTGNSIAGSTEFRKDNFSDGRIMGVEGNGEVFLFSEQGSVLDLEYPKISLYGSFSYTFGEGDALVNNVKTNDPLSRINPAQGTLGLRLSDHERLWTLEFETFWARKQGRLAKNDEGDTQRIPPGGTPGYTLLTLRGSYRLAPGTRLSAALENLTNRDYRVHGSGQNGPGLNFIVGAHIEF